MSKATHSRTTTPRAVLKYRRLWDRVRAIEAEMAALDAPGKLTPAMAKLEAKLERACADMTAAAEAIWRRPVRSLSDLHARLEVAQAECLEQRPSTNNICQTAPPLS